jgi:hypothetical protein
MDQIGGIFGCIQTNTRSREKNDGWCMENNQNSHLDRSSNQSINQSINQQTPLSLQCTRELTGSCLSHLRTKQRVKNTSVVPAHRLTTGAEWCRDTFLIKEGLLNTTTAYSRIPTTPIQTFEVTRTIIASKKLVY